MPRIACGLDKLKWQTISNMINYIFYDTKINITVSTCKQTRIHNKINNIRKENIITHEDDNNNIKIYHMFLNSSVMASAVASLMAP
jgi:hypothetical protein